MPEVAPVQPPGTWTESFRYTPAMRVGDLVLVSGQVGIGPDGAIVADDFLRQAHQAFDNLARVLEMAGSGLAKVVKVTFFLTDQAQFAHVLDLREQYFQPPYPADTTVVVAALARPGLLVEVEAIAVC